MKVRSVRHEMFFLFIVFLVWPATAASKLEVLSEAEVRQTIADEKYVVVLFTEDEECNGRCGELEEMLALIREDIVEVYNGWVVRTHSPALAEQYGINTKKMESSIIFLRNGNPLLYSGPADDDEMLSYFVTNPESSVHTLTDINFEHLTQAATGATTGDWLVMFVRGEDCPACTRLRPTLEAVAAKLRGSKNVALVDRDSDGGQTTRRFTVKQFPAFVLFRQGRLYRYTLPGVDVTSLISFTTDGFRNARAENIPLPKSPFDDYTEWCADWLRENPGTVNAVGLSLVLFAVIVGVSVWCSSHSTKTTKKESKKKK